MAKVVDQEYRLTPIAELIYHPRNANQGDLGSIIDSIEENDFYGAIVAQKSTGYVLAGNTRLRGAIEEGLTEVPVIWVDVADERALRMLIVDNRTTRLGVDDINIQAENLIELSMTDDGLAGTGFDLEDLDTMMSDLRDLPELESDGGRQQSPVVSITALDDEQAARMAKDLAQLGHPLRKVTIHCDTATERDQLTRALIDLGYAATKNGES